MNFNLLTSFRFTLIVLLGLLWISASAPHAADCEVLVESIQGTYEGDCKKGMAHGTGKAVGTDTYEGAFKKGSPNGEGTYTWANGDIYEGEFKRGVKEGQGLMTFASGQPPLKGYWIDDEYIGTDKTPYKVINKTVSANRVSFRRLDSEPNQIQFKFTRLGKPVKVRNLSIQGSYGVIMNETEFFYTVKVHSFPMQGGMNFSAMNQRDVGGGGGGDFVDGNMEFSINQSGNWEVTIEVQPE
ncbi:MAG: hypothetical protein AAF399_08420 [Bacteroidota bacterium]